MVVIDSFHCIIIVAYYVVNLLLGFLSALNDTGVEFTLVSLKDGVSSAVGAASLGAKAAGLSLHIDHSANVDVLFHCKN